LTYDFFRSRDWGEYVPVKPQQREGRKKYDILQAREDELNFG
jgi:hypothetical protein